MFSEIAPLSTRPCCRCACHKARGLSTCGNDPWADSLYLTKSEGPVKILEIKAEKFIF